MSDFKQFIGPFDFSNKSIEEIRESFSLDWRNYFPNTTFEFSLLSFATPDQTHVIFSYETMVTHAGRNYEEAIRAFIIALNGYYGHHLLNKTGPLSFGKKEGGLKSLQLDFEKQLGWSFSNSQNPTPISFDTFLKKYPEFKRNVMDAVKVDHIKFNCEIPKF